MFEWLLDPSAWMALTTLTLLEIVLGIDNIIFIAILVGKLPEAQRDKARILGLGLAMLTRIALLASLFWIMKLTQPLFVLFGNEISGRDIILIAGGLFLIYKSTHEIHLQLDFNTDEKKISKKSLKFFPALIQIAILDIIFSLDSVITAVGMADHLEVMIIAIILAVLIMMIASKGISSFVDNNPTIKTLALAFLILIGIALIGDGLDFHIPKGYIYFAMAFSLIVECINIYSSKKSKKQ
ncbi:TerC family protein [Helicobacter cappadocius]|uniref:TerC family protein n=1 Tax=Helicobacter cappadocius TaxID=3063998 RepID=A0AA90TCI2_9HELI|nr:MULTISPECIES: TerC family protein [unclassified Helicobacter]MDO7253762.1 TerC family protein [Helicobacter sp. faydin-H75]MDP2539691.1 TerC family protein [Helicobacter sp. faydin-H76]